MSTPSARDDLLLVKIGEKFHVSANGHRTACGAAYPVEGLQMSYASLVDSGHKCQHHACVAARQVQGPAHRSEAPVRARPDSGIRGTTPRGEAR